MLRTFNAIAIAAVVVLGLFWLMHQLILGGSLEKPEAKPTQTIDFVRLKRDSEAETRQRQKPEPPPPPKEPPPPPKLKVASETPQESPMPFNMPNLGLASNVDGGPFVGQLGGSGGMGMFDGDIIPLARINPQYPRTAARDGIEGYVKLEIVVNSDGSVKSAKVIDSKPRGVFDSAAVQAVYKWKFKPKVVNGQPVEQRGIQMLDFSLSE